MVTRYSETDRSALVLGACLVLALLVVLCCAGMASAQTPVVLQDTAKLCWEQPAPASIAEVPVTRWDVAYTSDGAASPFWTVSIARGDAGPDPLAPTDPHKFCVLFPRPTTYIVKATATMRAAGPSEKGVELQSIWAAPTGPFSWLPREPVVSVRP